MNPLTILDWQRDIAAQTQLSPAAKVVAFTLSHRVNGGKGDCFPSVSEIAGDSGISERHARRALAALEAQGYIRRAHIQGATNSYFLTTPARPAEGGDSR